jgi:hypothetical protein
MNNSEKPRLFKTIIIQFPKALKAVAKRSELGHKKYVDIDQDWQGFTRTPYEVYEDKIIRHMMQDGEENETELDHLAALAWNTLALLEIKLRKHEQTSQPD